MATVNFTNNLKRHLNCSALEIEGKNLAEILQNLSSKQQELASYIVDDQGRIRKHILISIDEQLVQDRVFLSDPVKVDSEIYILQALSGG